MATTTISNSMLVLLYEDGVDTKGQTKYKNKQYRNVKPAATADQLSTTAGAIASLQTKTLGQVERRDEAVVLA